MRSNKHLSLMLVVASLFGGGVTCVRAAEATPASDFYTWANADWLAKTPIPGDRPRVDNFSVLEDTVREQLRDLLTGLQSAPSRTPDQDKLMRLYGSFMDAARRDAKGLAAIGDELEKIEKLETHRDVARLFAEFQTLGVASPVMVAAEPDFKDSTVSIGFIAQSGLGIERDYYLGTDADSLKQQQLYRAYLAKLFALAALPGPDAIVARVFELETKLAGIQWSRVENRDMQKVYNPTTSAAFLEKSAEFHGDELMKTWGVPAGAKLSVMQPDYLAKYGALFRATPVATWKDYLRARLLTAYATLLTSDFKAADIERQKALGLLKEEPAPWKQGIDFVAGTADMMLGRAYVEKYYDKATKEAVTKIVLSIRDTYRASIEGAAWMSEETRRKALEKLEKMQFKVGYPDKWRDYSALEIPGLDLCENYRNAMRFDHQRGMAKIGKPIDRAEWDRSPHEINAFYNPTRNEFVLLAAILQGAFYGERMTLAEKYGGLGFVVGHEIGHGFDDQGSQFDGDGNMRNWWLPADTTAYNAKKSRLIAQANAFEVLPGTFLKGDLEIGEIMADLGGAQIALLAYRKTPDASDEAFFKQLAQTWRSKWRDEFVKLVIQSDNHPPSVFRSNGIVKQFEDFHQAFHVKPGDKMYLAPEERVLLW